jgi:NitT/TauT family transport system substrate-binding protein
MLRRTFLGAAAGAGAYAASACSRRPAGLDKVRVSARQTLYMAPFYLAQESGYFSGARLQIELLPVGEGYEATTLLAGGKLDVAFGAVSASIPNAVAQGAAVRVVAGRRRMTPDCSDTGALYGNRSKFPRGLARLENLQHELPGKRVAINSRTNAAEFYLDTLLAKAGLTETDIQIHAIRFSEAVAAVIHGRVDAFLAPEQFSAQTISDAPELIRGMSLAQILPQFQFTHIVYGKHLLHGDGELGVRFLEAFLRGVRDFMHGKTPRFLDEFARSYGYDAQRARVSCRDGEVPDGRLDRESLRLYTEWWSRKGYCPRGLSVDQIIDTRFIDGARKRLA